MNKKNKLTVETKGYIVLKKIVKKLIFINGLFLVSACNPVTEKNSNTSANMQVAQCISSQSQCEVNTSVGSFSIKFSQQKLVNKVKTELPFSIELSQLPMKPVIEQANSQDKQASITHVSAYLEGKDMFMGKVPVFFEQIDKGNNYLAQSLLASCSEEFMVWRLWVTVMVAEQKQTFFVDFTSQRL